MSGDSQREVIDKLIQESRDISPSEKLYFASELQAVSDMNGEEGKIGRAIKFSTYSSIVYRLGEKERMQKVISEHAFKCPNKKENKSICGELKTKWGSINGLSLIILLIVVGLLCKSLGPQALDIYESDKNAISKNK
jgi:hypothetical protein